MALMSYFEGSWCDKSFVRYFLNISTHDTVSLAVMIKYYEHVIVVTKVLKVTTGNAFIY